MMPRTKRAAATAAERKIKKDVEEFSREDEEESNSAAGPSTTKENEPKRKPKRHRSHQKSSITESMDFHESCKHHEIHRLPPKNNRPMSSEGKSVETKRVDSSSTESFPDSVTTLPSFSSSTIDHEDRSLCSAGFRPARMSTAAKARWAHQARRREREVNSDGPMILSYRTYHRMSTGPRASPIFSPIQAARLSFSPDTRNPLTATAVDEKTMPQRRE